MGALDGRVAVITGAGRGIGREHALLFAAEGAKVVVNDLGGAVDGSGDDRTAAEQVVAEITERGGEAITNDDDVADWEGGKRLIDSAIEAFGDLHVLVNNAGILRDRVLVNMTEEDWDSVIHVHLKGHFVPTRHAAAYWRERSKAGEEVRGSIINTSSTSGLLGNPGQSNYGAAKAGIAAFTVIAAQELGRYGVRVNAIAPAARTRMTESTPGLSDIVRAPGDESQFDTWGPGQHLAPGRLSRNRGVPGDRARFLRAGRQHPDLPELDHDRLHRPPGPLDRRRAQGGDVPAGGVTEGGPPGPGEPDLRGVGGPSRIESPTAVLDPATDPGGAAFGTTGAEATAELPWLALLRHRVQSRAQASPRYRWWVLIALLAGLFALNFTFTSFVVALPTVKQEFHTNFSVLTWVSTGPLLAFGLAAPLFGKAGDLFGCRRLYLMGLVGAMGAALMTALAPNVWVLLFARSLDGVQGAATGTASMALILRMFPPADRVKAMGWWSMVGAGGPVIGVTLGSPIIEFFGWRTLFWVQLGLLAVSVVVVALVLPAHGSRAVDEHTPAAPSRWQGMDWVGSWSLSGAVTGVMLALSVGPILGWSSTLVIVSVVVAVASVALFVYRERTAANPLIPTQYFRRRNFMLPMGTRAAVMFAYFGAFFLFPLMMEQVYGWSVTEVGLVSIARPLVFSVSSPVAGYLAVRIGERTSATVGAVSVVLSMVMFALLGRDPPMIVIVLALCLAGLGMGGGVAGHRVDPG